MKNRNFSVVNILLLSIRCAFNLDAKIIKTERFFYGFCFLKYLVITQVHIKTHRISAKILIFAYALKVF